MSQEPRPRILLAAADDALRGRLEAVLGASHDLVAAADGPAALAAAEAEPPDLVLVRADLPGMDGVALCRALRERDPHLPVLLMLPAGTGADADARQAAFEVGAVGYMLEPFSEIELSTRVRNLLILARLRYEERRKDEFAAMLAHELRNPLAPIQSGLDILALEVDARHHDTLELMKDQVAHLVRLVDDLLDLSRLRGGNVALRLEPVELSALVQRSVAAVRPFIDSRHHELAVALPAEPVWFQGDAVRLAQVLENLLNNAAKYTEPGGRIELSAEASECDILITVADSGIGIEPELLPRVFDMFAQSTRSLDRALGGLGVGLTLVRQVVEGHAGQVSAASDGRGRGSRFVVRLPRKAAAPPAADRPLEEDAASRARPAPRRHVLIVDDNSAAAEMLAMLLQKLGDHRVDTAADGHSGLARIRADHPDLVLLDIGLPGMDGYQVARAVREHPELDDVLLVAMTGYDRPEDRRRSKEAGFDEHLVKPVSLEQVLGALAHPKLTEERREPAATTDVAAPLSQDAGAPAAGSLRKIRHDLANSADVLQLFARLLGESKDDAEFVRRTAEGLQREVLAILEKLEAIRRLTVDTGGHEQDTET